MSALGTPSADIAVKTDPLSASAELTSIPDRLWWMMEVAGHFTNPHCRWYLRRDVRRGTAPWQPRRGL